MAALKADDDESPPPRIPRITTSTQNDDNEDMSIVIEGCENDPFDLDDGGGLVPVPPDGGFGWVIVLMSFTANMIVDGIAYAYGVLLPEIREFFHASPGEVALVGSLLCGVYLLAGPVVSGMVNKFGATKVMVVGAIISTAAFFVSVFSPSILMLMLTYGVVGGFGFGMIYLPACVHVCTWFSEKRSLASGIAVAGSGAGTFIFAPLCGYLLSEFDWRGTVWILAGLVLNCAVCGALMRPLPPPRCCRRLPEPFDETEKPESPQLNGRAHSRASEVNVNASMHQLHEARRRLITTLAQASDGRLGSISSINVRGVGAITTEGTPQRTASPTPRVSVDMTATPVRRDSGGQVVQGTSDGPPSPPASPKTTPDLRPKFYQQDSTAPPDPSRLLSRNASRISTTSMTGRGLSARSYADSLWRLSSVAPTITEPKQGATRSPSSYSISRTSIAQAQALANVDPKEFARPMYKQDVFYTGSIAHLPEYARDSQANLREYLHRTTSIPARAMFDDSLGEDVAIPETEEEECSLLPKPMRDTCTQMLDVELLRSSFMMLYGCSNLFSMAAFYVPFVFLSNRAIENGVEKGQAGMLLSIIGIANTLGRLFFGWFSDRRWLSALTINNGCLGICGVMTFLCGWFYSFGAMVAYAIVFGFFVSAHISLSSIILADNLGLEKLTNSFGLLILFRGVSTLVGTPIAGMVYSKTGSYDASFFFAGALLLVACLISSLIPCVSRIETLITRVRERRTAKKDVVLLHNGGGASAVYEDRMHKLSTVSARPPPVLAQNKRSALMLPALELAPVTEVDVEMTLNKAEGEKLLAAAAAAQAETEKA